MPPPPTSSPPQPPTPPACSPPPMTSTMRRSRWAHHFGRGWSRPRCPPEAWRDLLERQPLSVEYGGLAGLSDRTEGGAEPGRDAGIRERTGNEPQIACARLLAPAGRKDPAEPLQQRR